MQMRRVDVLRAFADRANLLAANNAIALINQHLVQMRVAQAGPVCVLHDYSISKAFGQIDRLNHEAGAHGVNGRLESVPLVKVDAAVALAMEGGIGFIIEDLGESQRDAPAAAGRDDDSRGRIDR